MTDETKTTDVALVEPDPCGVMSVQKVRAETNARCVVCHQREGNPGDCSGGDRFNVSFGAAGGVVLCKRALSNLWDKILAADPE